MTTAEPDHITRHTIPHTGGVRIRTIIRGASASPWDTMHRSTTGDTSVHIMAMAFRVITIPAIPPECISAAGIRMALDAQQACRGHLAGGANNDSRSPFPSHRSTVLKANPCAFVTTFGASHEQTSGPSRDIGADARFRLLSVQFATPTPCPDAQPRCVSLANDRDLGCPGQISPAWSEGAADLGHTRALRRDLACRGQRKHHYQLLHTGKHRWKNTCGRDVRFAYDPNEG